MFYVFADGESIFNPMDDNLAILSPKVTLELGKSGSFQFSIPSTHDYYNKLEQLKTSIMVELDNTEIFRGRILSITKGFNNIKTVYCEGILSYLVDSVQKARSFKGKASELYKKILERHNDMVEKDKRFALNLCTFGVEDADVIIPGKKDEEDKYYGTDKYGQAIIESLVDEWKTSYDYINSLFIDYLGGYLVAKYDRKKEVNYIDYISNDQLDAKLDSADHEIEFGINMLDFQEEVNAEKLFTVLIPLGDGEDDVLTIAGATNKSSADGIELVKIQGKWIGIADEKAREKYGSIIKTYSFENVNDPNTLFTNAVKYLKRHKNIPVTYTIKAVDMHFVNKTNAQIEIGDSVRVTSPTHGVDKCLLCTRIEYDLSNPANTSYTFGNPEQSMTERYKKNKDKDKKDSEHNDKRAAKGGGGAAGAARDEAIDEAEKKVNDLYNAYIKVDEATGTITMATLYKDIVDGKEHLRSMAGIDLDAGPDAAKVNIYTMYDDIGKANTRITQVSDDLHAEIEVVSSYAKGVNTALTSFKQYAGDTYASQEMLTQYKNESSEALSGLRTYANKTFATSSLFSEYKSATDASLKSLSEFKTTATDKFASFLTKSEYNTSESKSKAAIEGWVDENFAKITAIAEYETENGNSIADIEAIANANSAKISLNTSKIAGLTKSTAELTVQSKNTESVIKALTNYNDLKPDPKTGLITAVASKAKLNVTASDVKSAIDSDTNFSKYLDGKMTYSSTSIHQLADDAKAMVELIANFGSGHGAKITLKSFKDELTNHIDNRILAEADNIILKADQTTIDGRIFNAKSTAYFERGVSFQSVLYANGAFTTNGTASFENGFTSNAKSQINGDLVVQAGHTITIGLDKVALDKDIPTDYVKNNVTDVRDAFKGAYSNIGAALRSLATPDGYSKFADYIKALAAEAIDDKYIKGKITQSYIRSKIDGNFIQDALRGADAWGLYLRKAIGVTNNRTLKQYIEDNSKDHKHTVKIGTSALGHNHEQTSGTYTMGAHNLKDINVTSDKGF